MIEVFKIEDLVISHMFRPYMPSLKELCHEYGVRYGGRVSAQKRIEENLRRNDIGSNDGVGIEMARTTIGLMQEFDKLSNDVIVIGATNRMDRMDEALLRRFTRKHEVKRLNEHERLEMGTKFFCEVDCQISGSELEKITSVDDTQAGLMNRMIAFLVNRLMEE